MRRHILFVCLLSLVLFPVGASAQPRLAPGGQGLRLDPQGTQTPSVTSTTESEASAEEADPYSEEEAEPALRSTEAPAGEEEEGEVAAEAVPADADRLLEQAAPQEDDPLRAHWTAPERVFTIHGYLRTRAWVMDNYSLSRNNDVGNPVRQNYPFPYFIPAERGSSVTGSTCMTNCFPNSKVFRYADMRLRLAPTISLSDQVRIHTLIDVFDNMVLGSTPDTGSLAALQSANGIYPNVPVDTFASTAWPSTSGRNSLQDSIQVRRAWAEIGNHSIGQLRFGRMGNQWGLGMLWNDGRGLDSDLQTDVDRIMGTAHYKGFTFGAAWDFANAGVTTYPVWINSLQYDPSGKDNLTQFALFAGHRLDADEQRQRLAAGKWVLNGGVYFQFQQQSLSYIPSSAINSTTGARCSDANAAVAVPGSQNVVAEGCLRPQSSNNFFNRDGTISSVDAWGQFLYKDLRLELEVAGRFGGLNVGPTGTATHYGIRQWGYAFEGEWRTLHRKLGVYFYQGYASGDADVIGLSTREDHITQTGVGDHKATTLSFHPNYRIDLILFRAIMGSVAGVTYFKPGISYDLIRTDYGRVLGGRVDVIYSRANRAPQAYGDNPNLGLEVDASLYYRTEDGPDFVDGLFLGANYGILVPLAGLGYAPGELAGATDKTKVAMVFRVIMGVQF